MNIEEWQRAKEEEALALYGKSLERINEHAKRMAEGMFEVIQNVPDTRDLVENKDFYVEMLKLERSSYGYALTGMGAVVTVGQGEERSIYQVQFVDREYESLKLDAGFNVRKLVDPREYRGIWDALAKPEIWKKVDVGTSEFKIASGLAMFGMVEELTVGNSNDFNRCMDAYKKQTS
jgi:hypothetical protein